MKKLIFTLSTLSILFLIVSCNQSRNHHGGMNHDDSHEHHGAMMQGNPMTLNNGSKWMVDAATSGNYDGMKTMTNMLAAEPSPSLTNYQIYGNDLTVALNKMISECKMKGPDHDALHQWMEPLIKQANDLKNIQDSLSAKNLFDSVHTRVDAFSDYFTGE